MALPGFVAGYWNRDPVTGKAHGLIVFETEADARRLKDFIQGDTKRSAEAGLTYDSLAIVEVWGAKNASGLGRPVDGADADVEHGQDRLAGSRLITGRQKWFVRPRPEAALWVEGERGFEAR